MHVTAPLYRSLAALATLAAPAGSFAACSAQSGPQTTALVELYTSEGCSSCPPAEQVLARLPQVLGRGADAVAAALHVDYWDDLGWKDPYARAEFSQRHRWLVQANHHSTIYTPHFFVNGGELAGGQADLRAAVARANGEPAQAGIRLQATLQAPASLHVAVSAHSRQPSPGQVLYLGLAQGGLVSDVRRGENSGRQLAHEHVLRTWSGPYALAGGRLDLDEVLPLPAGSDPARLELLAVVQDRQTGRVLQALGTGACTGGPG